MATDVRIDLARTEIEITEPIGPLSAEEVRRLAMKVLEILRAEQHREAQYREDRAIRNRSYMPDTGTDSSWR